MSDSEDDVDDFMARADTLARERGYFERPSSELLQMAEDLCAKNYSAMRAMNKVGQGIVRGSQELWRPLLERGEGALTIVDDSRLEYFAAIAALSRDDRKAHDEAMTAKYGPGYLVGT